MYNKQFKSLWDWINVSQINCLILMASMNAILKLFLTTSYSLYSKSYFIVIMLQRSYIEYPPEAERPPSPDELRQMAREIARRRNNTWFPCSWPKTSVLPSNMKKNKWYWRFSCICNSYFSYFLVEWCVIFIEKWLWDSLADFVHLGFVMLRRSNNETNLQRFACVLFMLLRDGNVF